MKHLHTFNSFINEAKIIGKTVYSIDEGVRREIFMDHKYWSTQETNMSFRITAETLEDLLKQVSKKFPKCSMYIENGELIIAGYGGQSIGEYPKTADLTEFMKLNPRYDWDAMTVVKLSTKLRINGSDAEFEKGDYKSSFPTAEELVEEMVDVDDLVMKSNNSLRNIKMTQVLELL